MRSATSARCSPTTRRRSRPIPRHRLNNLDLGGGALLDLGIYPISFAWDILGAPTTVTATATIGATGRRRRGRDDLHARLRRAVDVAVGIPRRRPQHRAHRRNRGPDRHRRRSGTRPTSFRLVAPDGDGARVVRVAHRRPRHAVPGARRRALRRIAARTTATSCRSTRRSRSWERSTRCAGRSASCTPASADGRTRRRRRLSHWRHARLAELPRRRLPRLRQHRHLLVRPRARPQLLRARPAAHHRDARRPRDRGAPDARRRSTSARSSTTRHPSARSCSRAPTPTGPRRSTPSTAPSSSRAPSTWCSCSRPLPTRRTAPTSASPSTPSRTCSACPTSRTS